MIKNVILDFGKVLVDYDFERFLQSLRSEDDDPEAYKLFHDLILSDEVHNSLDKELTPFQEQIKNLETKFPQIAYLLEKFDKRWQEVILCEIPGMKALLGQLKDKGIRLYGLSNWSSKVYETMQNYDIFRLLDGRTLSCEEHVLKPESEIYDRLLQHFHLEASECLFVDDLKANIEGCKAVGMDGVVFQNAEQLRQELQQRGVL